MLLKFERKSCYFFFILKSKSFQFFCKATAEIVAFCIEHGKNYPLTIKTYGVSYQQIYAWVRKYEEKGVAGLVDGRGRNKPESEMTEVEKLRVQNKLLQAQIKDKEMEIALLKKLKELERWDV